MIVHFQVKDPKVKFSLQDFKKNTSELDQLNVKEIANASFLDQHILVPLALGDPPTLSVE